MLTVKLSGKEDLKNLKKTGWKVVMAHGCFDILHIGHIRHLQAAKALGDILIVSVTSDKYVNKGSGRPIFTVKERMETLCALQCVDYVVPNDAPDVLELLGIIRPNIFVKGADYKGKKIKESDTMKYIGGKIAFTDTPQFHTTDLIKRIKQC